MYLYLRDSKKVQGPLPYYILVTKESKSCEFEEVLNQGNKPTGTFTEVNTVMASVSLSTSKEVIRLNSMLLPSPETYNLNCLQFIICIS